MSTFSFSSFLLKEDERESRRKENKEERAPQSRWAFWRNGSFASSAQTVSRHLGETAGYEPRPQIRQYRICLSPQVVGSDRLLADSREGGIDRLWAEVGRLLRAVRVAMIDYGQ